MFSRYFAAALIQLVAKENLPDNLIICPPPEQECSIKDISETIKLVTGYKGEIQFENDPKNDGQFRKTASSDKFKSIFPEFIFTSLKGGLEITYKDFKQYNIRI